MTTRFRPLLIILNLFIGVLSPPGVLAQPGSTESIPLSTLRQASHIHGIAVDSENPSRLYLAAHQGLFMVSSEGLGIRLSQDNLDVMGFARHPIDPSVLYASGHSAGNSNLGLVMSSDGGKTWLRLSKGLGAPTDFHQIDISKTDPETIYGVFDGLRVSQDGGRTWVRTASAPADLIDLAASSYEVNRLYAATSRGLLVSQDRGRSWLAAYVYGRAATMVETTPNGNVYAFVDGKGLIKGSEPNLRWVILSSDFGDQSILHLAVDRSNENKLYAVTHKGQILASQDGGRTWTTFGTR